MKPAAPVTSIRSCGAMVKEASGANSFAMPDGDPASGLVQLTCVFISCFRHASPISRSVDRASSSAQHRNGRFLHPQPFLKNHEAKQDFVVIAPARDVLLEEFAHGIRAKIPIDPGTAVEKGIGHPAIEGG